MNDDINLHFPSNELLINFEELLKLSSFHQLYIGECNIIQMKSDELLTYQS